MAAERAFNIDTRFASNVKIFGHPEWLERYRRGERVYPICWEIDASNRCPYNCEHCCWGDFIEGHGDIMPEARLTKVLSEIKDLGGKSIIWSGGGDPLTHPNIVEVIRKSHDLGLENAMFTNGLGMTPKRAEELAGVLSWIRFHVGADNSSDFAKVHGVPEKFFSRALENIKNFCAVKERTANVGIGVPVNPDNFAGCKGLPDLAMSLGADFFQAKLDLLRLGDFAYSEWWYETVVPYFAAAKERLQGRVRFFSNTEQSALTPDYCHAHRIITAVTADGRIAFCKMQRDDKKTSLGNIHEQSLREIMDGERHRLLAETINLETCGVAQVHCPYRKTIQAIEIQLRNPDEMPPIPDTMEYINFF